MEYSIYILTGGKSSRMGTDKALTVVNKSSFLERILKSTQPLQMPITLVSSHAIHQNLEIRCIPDLVNDKGPVSGIASALADSKTPLNLVLSCDIPLLQFSLLDWLIKQHKQTSNVTILTQNGRKMPLMGIYNKNCESLFKKHLKNNQLKLMNVLSDLNVNCIEIPEKWSLQTENINTNDQLQHLLKWL